jgi:DNA-binding NarL/FixJ family response regulator
MKIVLADDHTLFRDALTQYIERSDPEIIVLLGKDFHEAMNILVAEKDVDLVMLDLRMPGMNGLQGLKRLRELYEDIPVAILSGLAEPIDVEEALQLGAAGYFPKTLPGKIMLQGIYKILQGEKFTPMDHNTNQILPSYHADPYPAGQAGSAMDVKIQLTPREKQVLGFLLKGASNKEIAQEMKLQVVTIKLHVRGICRKLGAKNRTQAALKAQQAGLTGGL